MSLLSRCFSASRRALHSSAARFDDADRVRVIGTRYIDVRSDTVTKPTAQMSLAIMDAQVGDDVFCEGERPREAVSVWCEHVWERGCAPRLPPADPTVNTLQKRTAEMFGKEAGLFVPRCTVLCVCMHLCVCL